MKKKLLGLTFLLFAGPIQAQNLNADWQLLNTLFTGEFNNFQQVWQEKEDGIVDSLVHEHIHSIFKPVSIPALGENVFFVKQYMNGDPSKIYRMRVYQFVPDPAKKAIRLDIYSFKDPTDEARFKLADEDPNMLTQLSPVHFSTVPGCSVYWQKQSDDEFIGTMKPRACNFISRRTNKRIYITDTLKLNAEEIWISDQASDEDGKYVFGHKGNIPHKLRRVRPFKGWVAIVKEGTDHNNIQDSDYVFIPNLTLHDQGVKKRIVLPDGTPTPYSFELSQVVFQQKTPVMKLALYEEGKSKAISYVWANPEAERIGLNLRWIQVGISLIK